MMKVEKDSRKKDRLASSENIDASRRKLLGTASKAAWVVPTLTFLALGGNVATATSVVGPPCEGGDPFDPCPTSNSGTTSNRRP